ncbi:hypothetical protein HNR02_005680 [Amycolatopsis endophytica]|uniref:Uncharacterized protein n=1 Tax=Amycolatopsis endophytica TaxID=860233 RepID=A0A853BBZ6_9PSEU|nr:hypothetical protein [Amycolatopsis endophytica]
MSKDVEKRFPGLLDAVLGHEHDLDVTGTIV